MVIEFDSKWLLSFVVYTISLQKYLKRLLVDRF